MKVEFNGLTALNLGVIIAVGAVVVLIIGVVLIMFCTSEKATDAIEQNKSEEGKVTLNVLVCNARVFENEEEGKGDPYIVLHFNGEKKKTQVQKDTSEPEWNEEFSFAQAPLDGGEGIKVELWGEGSTEDKLVGTALITDLNTYARFADGARHKHTLVLLNGEQVSAAELDVEVWAEVQQGNDANEDGEASESEGGESESEASESQGGQTTEQSENQESSQTTEGSNNTESGVSKEVDAGAQSSRSKKSSRPAEEEGGAPAQSTRSNQPATSRTHSTQHTHQTQRTQHTHHTHHTHADGDKSATTERSNASAAGASEVEPAKTNRSNATHHTSATHRTSATHHTHATESGGSRHHHGSHHHHSGGDGTTTEQTTHTSRTTSTSQTGTKTTTSQAASKSPTTSRSQAHNSKSPTTSRTNASKVPNNVSEYGTGAPSEVTVVYEGEKKKKAVPKGNLGVDNTNTEWLAYLINDGRKEDKKKKAEDL